MTWKTELRLDDLPPHSRLEAFCKSCSAARYYTVQELLARRALAEFAPDLAADEGLLSPPRANIGTPDAAAPALRLLNRLPAEGAVERAFFAEARERGLDVQDPEPRIAAMLDGVAARRAEAGRPDWTAEERAAKAERLRALWGSADVNLAAELVTERVRWARRPAEAPAAPVTRIAAAPETPRPLPGVERMLDHDQGEEARRIRRFGAPRPYGFSAECDVDAGLARIEAAAPLGEIRLVWDVLDDPDSVEEGDWTALPEDACAAVIPIPRRRFAAHARLKIFARAGARTWRREICLALQEGAPFALVIGGAGPAGGPRAVETRGARGPRGLAASR